MLIDFLDLIGKNIEVEISGAVFQGNSNRLWVGHCCYVSRAEPTPSSTFHLFIFKD